MSYSPEQVRDDLRRELKEAIEDARRQRNTPAWHALIPLFLGVLFGVFMVLLASLLARLF